MEHRGISGHKRRYRQLANILVRHGLGYFVGQFGLESVVPFHRGWFGHTPRDIPYTRPEHLRMALEEMGTVWIKFGQILSTRADLLPTEFIDELSRLQDDAPTVPWESIDDVIVANLHQPIEELFASFDREPLAAASIGQVHAATLFDGTSIIVKVQRPGIVEQVEEDLGILQDIALTVRRRWDMAEQYDIVGMVQEFSESLRSEMDYVREGRSAEQIAANFAQVPLVHVPRVYWERSSERVITLERVQGLKINDLTALDAAGIDRIELAQRAARMVMQMVFEDGFFHADPHPGNFFIEPNGEIALMDFGMVGVLTDRTKDHLVNLMLAVASKDANRMVDTVLEIAAGKIRADRVQLRQDVQRLVSLYIDRPIGDIDAGDFLRNIMEVVRAHHLQMPSNLALTLKMGVMVEGLGQQLDPDFRLVSVIEPYAQRLVVQRRSPRYLARLMEAATMDAAQLGLEVPGQLRRILGDLERGTLEIGARPDGLEPALDRLERLANRIVLSLIASAFIIGLAVLMAVIHPFGMERWMGIMFVLGFLIATALGTYIIRDILRSKPR